MENYQQTNSNNNETQLFIKIGIDETEDNKIDRTITISEGSSDIKNIIEKVVESEIQKTAEDVQSTWGVYGDDKWKEDINSKPRFEVKVYSEHDVCAIAKTQMMFMTVTHNSMRMRLKRFY